MTTRTIYYLVLIVGLFMQSTIIAQPYLNEKRISKIGYRKNSVNSDSISDYIVSQDDSTRYKSIQMALNDAASNGGGIIYVQPGIYKENLILFGNTSIIGSAGNSDAGTIGNTVVILGQHKPPNTGSFVFKNIKLESKKDIFCNQKMGDSWLMVENCLISTDDGYLFNLPKWTGTLVVYNVGEGSRNNGVVNNTSGAICFFISATLGAGEKNTMVTSGSVVLQEIVLRCPWDAKRNGMIGCDFSIFSCPISCYDETSGLFANCRFSTGSNLPLNLNSAQPITIMDSIIDTSSRLAIDGRGSVKLGGVHYLNSYEISNLINSEHPYIFEAENLVVQNISFDRGKNFLKSDGELIIGVKNGPPRIGFLQGGEGISIKNRPGSITVSQDSIIKQVGDTNGTDHLELISFPLGDVPQTYFFTATIVGMEGSIPSGVGAQISSLVRTSGQSALLIDKKIEKQYELELSNVGIDLFVKDNSAIIEVCGVENFQISWNAQLEYSSCQLSGKKTWVY